MMTVTWGPHCTLGDTRMPPRVHLRLLLTLWIFHLQQVHALYFEFVMESSQRLAIPSSESSHDTLSWAVKLREVEHRKMHNRTLILNIIADLTAKDLGLSNFGQVGELVGHYLLVHPSYYSSLNGSLTDTQVRDIQTRTENNIATHKNVDWFSQQQIRRRFKRSIQFNDPVYPKQWHLHNKRTAGMDINVTGIWEHNITGAGIVVAVIDDGLEWTNPDIFDNYCPEGSWDLNANDPDPMPEVHNKKSKTVNRHGTRCAGEIAAVPNDKCAVGVAYGAKVSGVRLLDGPMTDSLEATAFNKHMAVNDIYSCSWGPDDDGKTIDGPHPLAQAALKHGVLAGRRGRGSLFVVASGNGGRNDDNCNYDGYANSMYTITIGAVDERGQMPYYAEECASMLAVTFSSGSLGKRNIVTTDWTLDTGTGCTQTHTGTSAAAPLAAGMIALMLEAKECLSWRDVQHIIVYTSVKVDTKDAKWDINAAGFYHSHKHGFGLLSAWRLVNAAKVWHSVPWLTSLESSTMKVNMPIPSEQRPAIATFKVSNSSAQEMELSTLEHILVTVTLSHPHRGNLQVELISPSGTKSVIGAKRKKDSSSDGLKGWTFSTVRCWGEQPVGLWQLQITDHSNTGGGILVEWKIHLYGSRMLPAEVQTRKIMVEEAMSGNHLYDNLTEPCSFYWANTYGEESNLLTIKSIRLLCLVSGFLLLAAVYYSIEQAFCNDEDKEDFKQVETNNTTVNPPAVASSPFDTNNPERTRLLDEIPMQDLDCGLEEVITDFANARSDSNAPVFQHHTTHNQGRNAAFNLNNSSGQCSTSPKEGGGGGGCATAATSDSCVVTTAGVVCVEAGAVETSQVQSLNSSSIGGSGNGGGIRSVRSETDLSMLSETDDQLSMPSSDRVLLPEPHCEDNIKNEQAILQSPSLAVGGGVTSTSLPIGQRDSCVNTVICNSSDPEMCISSVPNPKSCVTNVSKDESPPVFVENPFVKNSDVVMEMCHVPKSDSNAPPFLVD